MRGLVSFIAFTLFLAVPAIASAQSPEPLVGCKTPFLSYTGPGNGDNKAGSISGAVQVFCDGTWIFADIIYWDEHTAYAKGDVLVIQEGLRVNAESVEMDRQTKLGTFFHAYGTARITDKEPEKDMFGTMEPEIMFEGEKLEKIGPKSYRLTDGMFSTCVQPTPRWQLTGKTATVILQDHASMKNAALRVKGVPVLFLPYMYYPLNDENRSTGFLIPTYSASGVRGQGFGDAFFWAIDRSQDATFYYEKFTKAGQQAKVEYEYAAAPTSTGSGSYQILDEKTRLAPDGSVERAGRRSYQVDSVVRQLLANGFWLTGNLHYVSDVTTQALYQQNIFEQSRRDRNLTLNLSGDLFRSTRRPLHVNVLTQQRDIFNGATVARDGRLPQVDLLLAGRGLTRSGPFQKVYFSASGQVAYRDVRPNLDVPILDRSLFRVDGTTNLSAPLSPLPYLDVQGTATWRITNWQESLDPATNTPVPIPLTRSLFTLGANIYGPRLERTFKTPDSSYATAFKHEIQPRVRISWNSPFNERSRVIQLDPQIDSLVGGTRQIDYSLTNVVYATDAKNPSNRREFLRVVLSQTWYSDAQAGAYDPNYPTATINSYSPLQFSVGSQPTDHFGGVFRVYIDPVVRAIRSYSFSAELLGYEHLTFRADWQKRQFLPTVPGYNNPNNASHYINGDAQTKFNHGRLSGRYVFNYDLHTQAFLQQRIQVSYSSQCCGVAVDYQMMNVSQFALQGVPRDRRVAVTFSLAGIGPFKTPLGAFGR